MTTAVAPITAPKLKDLAGAVAAANAIRAELKAENLESETAADIIVQASIAGGHVFMAGGAGSGKSQIIRGALDRLPNKDPHPNFITMARADMDSQAFFGPISLSALERDIFQHAIAGSLADTYFAYIDEFMDANDMVLRSMLMVMNERQFANGLQLIDVPLLSMFATTNFWRNEPEVIAVLDRFMVRHEKAEISTKASFLQVLDLHIARRANAGRTPGPVTKLTFDQLTELQTAAAHVIVPADVRQAAGDVWQAARHKGVTGASVRRFNIGLDFCQAGAILRGADTLAAEDLGGYAHVLPSDPDEFTIVAELTSDFASATTKDARALRKVWKPLATTLAELQGAIGAEGLTAERSSALIDLTAKINDVIEKVTAKVATGQANGHDVNDLLTLKAEGDAAVEYIIDVAVRGNVR